MKLQCFKARNIRGILISRLFWAVFKFSPNSIFRHSNLWFEQSTIFLIFYVRGFPTFQEIQQ